jgi:hypothetical protein
MDHGGWAELTNRASLMCRQGTMPDISSVLEAHPTYSGWLDWTTKKGHRTPKFQGEISKSLTRESCFVPTGRKVGRCLEYRYCP